MKDHLKETIYIIMIVILSFICSTLIIYKNRDHCIISSDSTTEFQIGDRLILEDIDENGTIYVVPEEQSNTISVAPQLIWNADDEGIPPVGGLIKVEQIQDNRFYLIPVE